MVVVVVVLDSILCVQMDGPITSFMLHVARQRILCCMPTQECFSSTDAYNTVLIVILVIVFFFVNLLCFFYASISFTFDL